MEDIMIDDDDVMLDFERKKIICDNFVFICFVYIFESLISIICFYLFYKFKFGDKNNKIYEIIEFSLLGILFLSYIFLYGLIESLKEFNINIKCLNLIQFILIYIHKICLFIFLYLITVLNGEKEKIFHILKQESIGKYQFAFFIYYYHFIIILIKLLIKYIYTYYFLL